MRAGAHPPSSLRSRVDLSLQLAAFCVNALGVQGAVVGLLSAAQQHCSQPPSKDTPPPAELTKLARCSVFVDGV
jgi:hypothetical protein